MEMLFVIDQLTFFADASGAGTAMSKYIAPTITTLCALAGVVAAGFIAYGGYQMTTSTGQPDKLESAKLTIRNAILGLIIISTLSYRLLWLHYSLCASQDRPVYLPPCLASSCPIGGLRR